MKDRLCDPPSADRDYSFEILTPAKAAVILDASLGSATEVVLQSLSVHLESWQFPIPTFSIFLAAFSSLSCSVLQFKQSTKRIDKSILPQLKPQSEKLG